MNRRWVRRAGIAGDDAGSATVAGAAVILGVVALALVLVTGVSAVVQGHRASVAADMTALSAATVMQRAGVDQACLVAGEIATGNGAELTACSPVVGVRTAYGTPGLEGIRVEVRVDVPGLPRTAVAAAGPVE